MAIFSLLTMTTQLVTHVNVLAQALEEVSTFGAGPNEPVRQLRFPGDLIIGGVFPVHAKGSPCGEIQATRGVHRVEAMLYALDMINEQTDFLRGYRLGALILDSCSNPAYALNQSLDFVRDMIGSTETAEYQCPDGRKPLSRHAAKKSVVAVVGASYSSVTVQVANLLRLFRIVQVSPASTNADLSDKSRFEYFARTVPSDTFQARAMIDIARRFNWTYISLVYSADEYGELGADAFKKEARKANICIASEERIAMKPESIINESIANVIKKLQPELEVGARVVALFVGSEYIPMIMEQTATQMEVSLPNNRYFFGDGTRNNDADEGLNQVHFHQHTSHSRGTHRKRIIWLASESWDRNNPEYTVGARKLAAQGAIVLMLESQRVPSFEEYYLSLYPGQEKFERNKWLRELWRHKFNCEFNLPPESTQNRCEAQRQTKENFNPDDKVQFVIEAVYAIAHALQAMKRDVCPADAIESDWISRYAKVPEVCQAMRQVEGDTFYEYLLNVKFEAYLKFIPPSLSGKGLKPMQELRAMAISLMHFFFCLPILPCKLDLVGKKVHFTRQGDGPAHYTILNYQPSATLTGYSDSSRNDYIEVGRWSEDRMEIREELMFWNTEEDSSGITPISQCSNLCSLGYRKQLVKPDEGCCWACGKCEDYEYLPNETSCVDCGIGHWPTADRKDWYGYRVIAPELDRHAIESTFSFDLSINHLKHMRWSTWYSIIPAILALLGIISTLGVIVIYILNDTSPVVKASGRELSYILLASIILCYLMTFALISPPTTFTCAVKRTGIGFAFSSLYAALLVKTNRIHRIFSQATRTAQRPRYISPPSQVVITACLSGPQLVGSLIWLLFLPPGTRHDYPSRSQVVLTCNVPDHHFLYSLTYDAVLIILCTIYAVKTREVPENFNETRFIGFTMYTTCVVWMCCILFFFGTGNDFSADFQIKTTALCISISMSANVALACIFSPKLYMIIFEKDRQMSRQNTDHIQRQSYRSTLSRRSQNQESAVMLDKDKGANTHYGAITTVLMASRRKLTLKKYISEPTPTATATSSGSNALDTFL